MELADPKDARNPADVMTVEKVIIPIITALAACDAFLSHVHAGKLSGSSFGAVVTAKVTSLR